MSIALVVTRGYGNGTYDGTIADVVTRGYGVGAVVDVAVFPGNETDTGLGRGLEEFHIQRRRDYEERMVMEYLAKEDEKIIRILMALHKELF